MFVITDVIQASATWNSLWNHIIINGSSSCMEYPELKCCPIIENAHQKSFILSDQIKLKSGFLKCIIYGCFQTLAVKLFLFSLLL